MAFLAFIRPRAWRLPDAARGLRGLSLRFHETWQEQGFVQSRAEELRANVLYCCVTSLLLFAGTLAFVLLAGWHEPSSYPSQEGLRYNTIQLAALGVSAFISVVLAVAARAPQVTHMIGPVGFEWLTVLCMMSVMSLIAFTEKWHLCKLNGHNPRDILGGAPMTDSGILLVIDAIVTGSHVAFPVRWVIMLPLEVLAVLLYAERVALGSPETTAVVNLLLLTALVVASAVGLRVRERRERAAFVQLVQERVLRCNAEFRLEQLGDLGPAGQSGPRSASGSDSAPTTTFTGRVFELEEGRAEVASQLARIDTLGRQEHWLLEPSEVALLPHEVLGQGGFGLVVSGRFCGMPVAVKLVRQKHSDAVLRHANELANELRILRQLRHPNIVFVHGAVVDLEEQQIGLVLEMVQGRTLERFLCIGMAGGPCETELPLPEPSVRYQVVLGVCRAFLYLHSRRPCIVHGDLKGANVLVRGSGEGVCPKLLDFGLARVLTRNARPLGGTLTWMAPEVLRQGVLPRCSADIFSLGMLLHFVATRVHPREGMSRRALRRALRTAQPVLLSWPIDAVFQPYCRPLVEACLQVDEQSRPSMAVVFEAVSAWPRQPGAAAHHGSVGSLEWSDALWRLRRLQVAGPAPQKIGAPTTRTRQGAGEVQPAGEAGGRFLPSQLQPISALPRPEHLPVVQEEGCPAPSCGRGAEASAVPRLVLPGNRPTEEAVMLYTVVQACLSWNYEVPATSCCAFHAGTRTISRLARKLHSTPCRDLVPPYAQQCQQCGLLQDREDEACSFCGGQSGPTCRAAPQRLEAL